MDEGDALTAAAGGQRRSTPRTLLVLQKEESFAILIVKEKLFGLQVQPRLLRRPRVRTRLPEGSARLADCDRNDRIGTQ